jgi:hypothetical protein
MGELAASNGANARQASEYKKEGARLGSKNSRQARRVGYRGSEGEWMVVDKL